jgi:UDP-2,3-diacylglucosamine pyrophosphatase LpxH
MSVKDKTDIIYIRGNHDDFLDAVLPFKLGRFSIRKLYIHKGIKRNYLVTHGDMFDSITTKMRWLSKLGDIGYTLLLWINLHYNKKRIAKGLPYDSISQRIKARVKTVVSYISDFEIELSKFARVKGCTGVICGHIHQPAQKTINGVLYLNSGDWVESLSALVENAEGNWQILYYHEWVLQAESTQLQFVPESELVLT